MTFETLIKLSLQYLEVDADMNTSEYNIEDLLANDTFAEYIKNIENSVYSGIARYVSSNVLPIQEIELQQKVTVLELGNITIQNDSDNSVRSLTVKERIFNKVKEVYCLDENSNVIHNVPYTLIGSKLILKEYRDNYTYYVVYYPNVMYIENYRDDTQTKYDIELSMLKVVDSVLGNVYVSIPDTMAINIKYMIYSEAKLEENASVSITNKNMFESYLQECKNQVETFNYQTEYRGVEYEDSYADDIPSVSDIFDGGV